MKHPKHTILTMSLLALGLQSWAQKEVVSAFNANKTGDFVAAATYIEEAINNPKANVKEKTWRYRGDIYLNIACDTAVLNIYPNALQIAFESFEKALSLDKKGSYKEEVYAAMSRLNNKCNELGIQSYTNNDYDRAGDRFLLADEVAEVIGLKDTNALYNAGLSFKTAGNVPSAEEAFLGLFDIAYQPVNMILLISETHREAGDTEKALTILDFGIEKHPLAQELYIEKFNIYNSQKIPVSRKIFDLESRIDSLYQFAGATDKDLEVINLRGQQDSLEHVEFALSEKSKTSIMAVVKADSSNTEAWFACAVTLMDLGLEEDGVQAYSKLLELDSTYQTGWFNFGLYYYDKAVEKKKELGGFPLRLTKPQQAKYDELNSQMNYEFGLAREYWGKAFDLDESDCSVVQALINVNIYMKDVEKEGVWQSYQEANCN